MRSEARIPPTKSKCCNFTQKKKPKKTAYYCKLCSFIFAIISYTQLNAIS